VIAKKNGRQIVFTEGGSHTKARIGTHSIAIPRHNEIGEMLARAIIKQVTKAARDDSTTL